jgi:hypothetical protein
MKENHINPINKFQGLHHLDLSLGSNLRLSD